MIFAFLVAGFAGHVILQRYFVYNGIGVNLLMLLTIQISLVKGSGKGQMFGFFSGFLEDILTAGLLGEKALLRTILGFSVGRLKGKFSEGNIFFQFFLTFTVFIIFSYMSVLLKIIFSQPYSGNVTSIALYSGLNALFAPLLYKMISFIYAR